MKRKKANFADIINNNISYFAHARVMHTKTGVTGTRFVLDRPLTTQQRAYFGQFQNIELGRCWYRYAPEIQYEYIVLLDKCTEGRATT